MAETVISEPYEAPGSATEVQMGYSAIIGTSAGSLTGLSEMQWSRRTGIIWEETEVPPGSESYDWDELDEEVLKSITNSYGLVVVVKTGHASGVVDQDCYDATIGSFTGDGESNRLLSCPIVASYLPKFKTFIRAMIRRYGKGPGTEAMTGMNSTFRLCIEIENEAASRGYWNRDIMADGTLAAQNYIPALQAAYDAKTEESASNVVIVLCGIVRLENLAACDADVAASDESCSLAKNIRLLAFVKEILKHPEYFDAIDVHFFNYYYFMPFSVERGMAWLRNQCRANGYELSDKQVFCLEWTPAFLGRVRENDGRDAVQSYFPYSGDAVFVGAPYLDEPIMLDENGVVDPEDVPLPCYFEGLYTGSTQKTLAVAMTVAGSALTPQQFISTLDYQGDGLSGTETSWSSPVAVSASPILLTDPGTPAGEGIYVVWDTTKTYGGPFGVGSVAYPSGTPAGPETLIYYYLNLDFLELPPPEGLSMDSKYRKWFETEEALDMLKVLCLLIENGVERTVFIKFHNYYPGYSWDAAFWKWHGLIRVTGGTVDSPTIVKKPSWYVHLMWETYVAGYIGMNPYYIADGVTCYQFNYTGGVPRYIMWATPTNTLDSTTYDGGDVALAAVNVALANALGWTTAIAREVVTTLDGSNDPVYTTHTVSGASTVSIGNIPKIVIKVA